MLWRKLTGSLILAIALISVDYRYAVVDRAAPLLDLVIHPIMVVASLPQQLIDSVYTHYQGVEALAEENRKLRQQLLENVFSSRTLEALEDENRRLRTLAQLDIQGYSKQALVAVVTKSNTNAFRQTITINRGTRDGTYVGQPVLDERGIVGQISNTSLFQSTVLLVTDVSHALMVRNARTNDRYLAHGNGQGLTLKFVPRHNDLKSGDVLLTSGLDETYPEQHLVGKVTQIITQPGRDFLEADVQAGAQLHRNREVLLIWNRETPEEVADAD